MSRKLKALARNIRLLLMDVDGVLTDGKLYNVPGPDGKMAETKGFDSQDGIALQWLARLGIGAGQHAAAADQLGRALEFYRSVAATRYIRQGEALVRASA